MVAQDTGTPYGVPDLPICILGQGTGLQTAQRQPEKRRRGGRRSQMIHNTVKRRRPLVCRIVDNTAYVTITSHVVVLDAEDLPLLEGWAIGVTDEGYVGLQGSQKEFPPFTVRLSRLITNAPMGMEVDHISGDRLDNRKSNLRICTKSENQQNCRKRSDNCCNFKGVSYAKTQRGVKKYRAQIRANGSRIFLGWFRTPEEAARAYNAKAHEMCGEYARINVMTAPGQTVAAIHLAKQA